MDEWVQIIHPGTGGTGEVHRSSLPQHYAAGWRLLAEDDIPEPEPEPEPEPMTRAQAAKAAKKAAEAESEEK
jgi:hypothetical protein